MTLKKQRTTRQLREISKRSNEFLVVKTEKFNTSVHMKKLIYDQIKFNLRSDNLNIRYVTTIMTEDIAKYFIYYARFLGKIYMIVIMPCFTC